MMTDPPRHPIYWRAKVVVGVIWCGLLLCTSFASSIARAAESLQTADEIDPNQNVLLLAPTAYGRAGLDSYIAAFTASWRKLGMNTDALYVEYLDLARNTDAVYRKQISELLLHQYASKKLDLIVALEPPALKLLQNELKTLSPEAPVITGLATVSRDQALASGRRFLEQSTVLDYGGTLDMALRMFPATTHVLVVGGTSGSNLIHQKNMEALAPRWKDRVSFEYTYQLTADQILKRVTELKTGSIVLRGSVEQDAAGRAVNPIAFSAEIARLATVPTFILYDPSIDVGPSIGGLVFAVSAEGERAAQMAFELVQGRKHLVQPITPFPSQSVPMFDWAEMQRWGADESVLPAGSVMIHRPPSLWEEHPRILMATTATMALLLALIAALAFQNQRRRIAEVNALESEANVKLLVEHAPDAIAVLDLDTDLFVDANKNAEILFGCSHSEILRSHADRFYALRQPDGLPVHESMERARERTELGEHVVAERLVLNIQGQEVLCEVHLLKMPTGKTRRMRLSFIDITQRRQDEERIHSLAFYDPMTGLPNRRLLLDRLNMALLTAKRVEEYSAVLLLDLDHFKNVNDARGHAVGDGLLQQVALRLTDVLREEDTLARVGGDEFVILMTHLGRDPRESAIAALGLAEEIRENLMQPFLVQGQACSSGASIGVTLLSPESHSEDDLLREADTAMYRAKSAGRNGIAFFEPSMHTEVQQRLVLETDLKQSLALGQMEMYLQSQVDAAGLTCGGELLLRWNHPKRGFVSPAQFIPVAESTGMILELGDWMLAQGCQILNTLAQAGHEIPLSINVSPRQFRQSDFAQRVSTALQRSGAPASRLILEVTEGLLIEDMEGVISRMHTLTALGVRFSIDDFGTGYSSLAYLNRMPLYELKIDQSFVEGLPDDANAQGIVQSILSMARHFSLHVVAEGVETQAQADYLVQHGCNSLQGYLYSRPLPLQQWLATT